MLALNVENEALELSISRTLAAIVKNPDRLREQGLRIENVSRPQGVKILPEFYTEHLVGSGECVKEMKRKYEFPEAVFTEYPAKSLMKPLEEIIDISPDEVHVHLKDITPQKLVTILTDARIDKIRGLPTEVYLAILPGTSYGDENTHLRFHHFGKMKGTLISFRKPGEIRSVLNRYRRELYQFYHS